MRVERCFEWRQGIGLIPRDNADEPPLVVDSWLVRDGRVRGIELHRRRFFRACVGSTTISIPQLRGFWADALARLPRTGDWFPRVELCLDPTAPLRLRIRPAPARTTEARVWIADTPDPRMSPRRKGPDLTVLAGLRGRAQERGADDALLVSEAGLILESAHAGVLWWDGNDLCVPSPTLPTLASVTSGLIQDRAAELGVRVLLRRRTPKQLDGREVWLVNALHGIRPVIGWPGSQLRPGPAVRAPRWQAWLDELDRPLPSNAPAPLKVTVSRTSSPVYRRREPSAW